MIGVIYFEKTLESLLDIKSKSGSLNICNVLQTNFSEYFHYFEDDILCRNDGNSYIPSYYNNLVFDMCFNNISYANCSSNDKRSIGEEGKVRKKKKL